MEVKIPLSEMLHTIDAKNADGFVSYLTDDAVFRYGSQDPVHGKPAIRAYVVAFFEMIQTLRHRVSDIWQNDTAVVCEGDVTYLTHDERELTVPFVNVMRHEGGVIRDYRVYIDPTPLQQEG